jgi:hypothetical protein
VQNPQTRLAMTVFSRAEVNKENLSANDFAFHLTNKFFPRRIITALPDRISKRVSLRLSPAQIL